MKLIDDYEMKVRQQSRVKYGDISPENLGE